MLAENILSKHPDRLSRDAPLLYAAINDVLACGMVCTACADACLSEPTSDRLQDCIRLCLDCADACVTTARLVIRSHVASAPMLTEMLAVCATACRLCGAECARHADSHDHCRRCAEACAESAMACQRALGATG